MADSSASLSSEEFQRMQDSLLELRTSNYQLAEKSSRKDREITNLEQKIRKLEDEIQKLARIKRSKGDILDTSESEALRHKLSTQEEEFRLQQATLIGELQRVIAQQEELEEQVRDLKESGGSSTIAELENEIARLKTAAEEAEAKYEQQLDQLRKSAAVDQSTSLEISAEKFRSFESELVAARNAVSALEQEKKALIGKLNNQNEEIQAKSSVLQKEIVDLKDQLRRKQASYVSLSEEKERNLEDFKKLLDSMVEKKDTEIRTVLNEWSGLKLQIEEMKDAEGMAAAEKASLETALKESEAQIIQVRERNEGCQIQLQETISANDCLSGQLQEAREEVQRMQQQLEEANQLAAKRKNLLDEMSKHLDSVKEDFQKREMELVTSRERDVAGLMKQLELSQKEKEELGPLQQKVLLLESLLQTNEDRCSMLEKQLAEFNSNVELRDVKHKEAMDAERARYEYQVEELRMQLDLTRSDYERQLAFLNADRESQLRTTEELKQEVKDKEDGVIGAERKYQSLIKDLKRQLLNEKKRSDRLQEKAQDNTTTAESTRNRSPGNTSYEEIRSAELQENRPRGAGDAASVSSWTVVSGNAQKDTDRHSTHTGSESSVTMLEADNHELIARVAELQRKNFEMQERVNLLEDSSSAMTEDLMKKSKLIEQFLKEKSAFHIGPPVSPEKLPPGLKKVMDLMKIDQSAVDIRDMNKRLQVLLEETLTKNMHLQKDLEIMSQEVARLSTTVSQEKQRFPTL